MYRADTGFGRLHDARYWVLKEIGIEEVLKVAVNMKYLNSK